jgi:hypothetical protein
LQLAKKPFHYKMVVLVLLRNRTKVGLQRNQPEQK